MAILLIACGIGAAYATVIVTDAPIGLPFVEAAVFHPEIPDTSKQIMEQWTNRKIYEPKVVYDNIEEIIEDENLDVEEVTDSEFYTTMNLVDKASLETYIQANPDVIKNGYEKLFFDKVDLLNTPTGVKTTKGHDVLAIDALDGITMIGLDVTSSTGTSKVKLAVVNHKEQLDMSLVKNLGYWDRVKEHATETQAILAINASTYTWNEAGNYGMLYGAIKYHDTLHRKAVEPNSVTALNKDGTLVIGANLDTAYNAFETTPILMKDGQVVYVAPETESRAALSAIGQTADGKTLILAASGGPYGSNLGITPSEALKILQDYGAVNAVCLSGGSRTMMYWNGRYVVEAVNYQSEGVKLPNAIVVKPAALVPGLMTTESKDETNQEVDSSSQENVANTDNQSSIKEG